MLRFRLMLLRITIYQSIFGLDNFFHLSAKRHVFVALSNTRPGLSIDNARGSNGGRGDFLLRGMVRHFMNELGRQVMRFSFFLNRRIADSPLIGRSRDPRIFADSLFTGALAISITNLHFDLSLRRS